MESTLTPEYVGGFFDGDGNVSIVKIAGGYNLRVDFSQCYLPVLEVLQKEYGGKINGHTRTGRGSNHRTENRLTINGSECKKILETLKETSILKYDQVMIALDMLPLSNLFNAGHLKEEIFQRKQALKEKNKKEGYTNQKYERYSHGYLAGLFDAEGCVQFYDKISLKLTQKSDKGILDKVMNEYNGSYKKSSHAAVIYRTENITRFINDIYPYIYVKKEQCRLAMVYINGEDKSKEERARISELIKAEKHINYVAPQNLPQDRSLLVDPNVIAINVICTGPCGKTLPHTEEFFYKDKCTLRKRCIKCENNKRKQQRDAKKRAINEITDTN